MTNHCIRIVISEPSNHRLGAGKIMVQTNCYGRIKQCSKYDIRESRAVRLNAQSKEIFLIIRTFKRELDSYKT
jgi:hypothetical protein